MLDQAAVNTVASLQIELATRQFALTDPERYARFAREARSFSVTPVLAIDGERFTHAKVAVSPSEYARDFEAASAALRGESSRLRAEAAELLPIWYVGAG